MKRKIIPPLLLLALAAGAGAWWLLNEEEPEDRLLATGTVEATEARLGFPLPGRLAEVRAREGEAVAAGAALAVLDRDELLARRRQAEAGLEAARARLAELVEGTRREEVAQARAAAAAAGERLADAERDLARAEMLHAGGAASREALDKARTARDLAARALEQAEEALALAREGPRRERVEAARAQAAEAEAALATLETTLADTELRAPFAGLVTARHREPGETVAAGAPVVSLLDPDDRWVRIYVPEDRLGAVSLGAAARIRCDTFPDKVYRGEVSFLAAQAEFTPKSVQTREERVRLVYAVKVRVLGDEAYELKPGLPVDVEIPLGGVEAGP